METYTHLNTKPTKKIKNAVRSITINAMLLALLVAQEEALIMIPNFQFTSMLIIAYAVVLPLSSSLLIVFSYVIIDGMYMGTLFSVYTIPMLISWLILAYVSYLLRNRHRVFLIISAFAFGFVYGMMFIPFNMLMLSSFHVLPYFLMDLPFELIMAITNLILMILIYPNFHELLKNAYYK